MTETIELKGGNTTTDRRLDRVQEFDERSRNYPVRTAELGTKQPRSYTWRCGTYLDQGREGACVGFSWAHELSATPLAVPTSAAVATMIYKRAQFLDPWPGENYSGTSVLAGAKAVQEMKHPRTQKALMPEYRWAFGVNDLILAVGYKGPAVIGINWYTGMFNTNSEGFIAPTGTVAGGHAILCRGFRFAKANRSLPISWENMDRDKSYFLLHNSWGNDWGVGGTAKVSVNNMNRLLNEGGDACVPAVRV